MSTRSVTDKRSFFATDQAKRDAQCKEKDAVVERAMERLRQRDPRKLTAVLMPSMYGPEVVRLESWGVPSKNIFAIERDPDIHAVYLNPPPGLERYHDMRTTPCALPVEAAMDHVPFRPAGFVYLDFFAQPNGPQLHALYKMFRLGVCGPTTLLLVTFGANRGDAFSNQLNARLKGVPAPGQAYIEAAADRARGPSIRSIANHAYSTSAQFHRQGNFITTEVHFEGKASKASFDARKASRPSRRMAQAEQG